ncbi:putative dual specificity protein phosphatase DSP8 [Bienertia sinuspersici]
MATQQKDAFTKGDDVVDEKEKKSKIDAKKMLIGAGARVLFYPTLLYNVLRNKIESDFRWWDEVDQFLFMGAVPFPKDVPRLKQLGVSGVIMLNEPFETLVPSSMYKDHGMEHLIIPTRDYLYAPSFDDINRAVDFIHSNASCGRGTYVHCKAGRGRSTTIALCYLLKYKQMTVSTAIDLIRAKRPRVLLTSMQTKTVEQYYVSYLPVSEHPPSDEVLVMKADVEGYNKISDDSSSNQEVIFPKAAAKKPSSLFSSLKNSFSCVSFRGQQPN